MQAFSNTNRPVHELIALDHRSFNELYDRYLSFQGQPQEQQKIANELIREVVQHSAAEETEVYPVIASYYADGRAQQDHLVDEHQHVTNLLYKLQSLTAGDADFNVTLKEAMVELNHHAKDEEERKLPDLLARTSYEFMIELGQKFLGAKMIAPTNPHPAAPRQPTAQAVVGLMTKPFDKIRDATKSFAERAVPEE